MSNKVPKIRFKGFTEDWEEYELGKIGDTYTGLSGKTKEDFGRGKGKYVTYMNVFANPVASLEQLDKIEIDKNQKEVIKGDVFFTTSSETPDEVGLSSVWIYDQKDVYLNSFCFGYRPKFEIDSYYLAYLLRSSSIRKEITFLAQGISRYNISKTKVMEINIPIASKKEQIKIGEYFKTLDNLINNHQNKYNKLISIKKSMLEKMFPKEGEDAPEIRFKGFTEPWKKCELGKLTDITKLAGFEFTKYITYSDTGKIIAIRGLNVKNGKLVLDDVKYIDNSDFTKLQRSKLYKDDILFTYVGTVGELAIITEDNKYYLAPNVSRIRIKNSLKATFIAQFMRRETFYNTTIFPLIATSSQPALSMENIRKFIVVYPDMEDQINIGE